MATTPCKRACGKQRICLRWYLKWVITFLIVWILVHQLSRRLHIHDKAIINHFENIMLWHANSHVHQQGFVYSYETAVRLADTNATCSNLVAPRLFLHVNNEPLLQIFPMVLKCKLLNKWAHTTYENGKYTTCNSRIMINFAYVWVNHRHNVSLISCLLIPGYV